MVDKKPRTDTEEQSYAKVQKRFLVMAREVMKGWKGMLTFATSYGKGLENVAKKNEDALNGASAQFGKFFKEAEGKYDKFFDKLVGTGKGAKLKEGIFKQLQHPIESVIADTAKSFKEFQDQLAESTKPVLLAYEAIFGRLSKITKGGVKEFTEVISKSGPTISQVWKQELNLPTIKKDNIDLAKALEVRKKLMVQYVESFYPQKTKAATIQNIQTAKTGAELATGMIQPLQTVGPGAYKGMGKNAKNKLISGAQGFLKENVPIEGGYNLYDYIPPEWRKKWGIEELKGAGQIDLANMATGLMAMQEAQDKQSSRFVARHALPPPEQLLTLHRPGTAGISPHIKSPLSQGPVPITSVRAGTLKEQLAANKLVPMGTFTNAELGMKTAIPFKAPQTFRKFELGQPLLARVGEGIWKLQEGLRGVLHGRVIEKKDRGGLIPAYESVRKGTVGGGLIPAHRGGLLSPFSSIAEYFRSIPERYERTKESVAAGRGSRAADFFIPRIAAVRGFGQSMAMSYGGTGGRGISGFLGSLGAGLMGKGGKGVSGLVGRAVHHEAKSDWGSVKIFGGIMKGLGGLIGIISKMEVFEPITDMLSGLVEIFGTAFIPIITQVVEALTPAIDAVTQIVNMLTESGAMKTLGDIFTKIIGFIVGILTDPTFMAALKMVVEAFGIMFKEVFKALMPILPVLLPLIVLFATLLTYFATMFGKLVTLLSPLIHVIFTSIVWVVTNIINGIISFVNTILPDKWDIPLMAKPDVPSMDREGLIERTGIAKVHAGEMVVRRETMREIFNDMKVTNNFYGDYSEWDRVQFERSMTNVYNKRMR